MILFPICPERGPRISIQSRDRGGLAGFDREIPGMAGFGFQKEEAALFL
jgi:hypothetical protein